MAGSPVFSNEVSGGLTTKEKRNAITRWAIVVPPRLKVSVIPTVRIARLAIGLIVVGISRDVSVNRIAARIIVENDSLATVAVRLSSRHNRQSHHGKKKSKQ